MFHTGTCTSINLLIIIMIAVPVVGFNGCKWANEDCEEDEDCCNGACSRLHEGTNKRCETSHIGGPCYFVYQCSDGLLCGEHYACCADYGAVCRDVNDCCNSSLVCRNEDGFIYKRCLSPSLSPQVLTTNYYLLILTVIHNAYIMYCCTKILVRCT